MKVGSIACVALSLLTAGCCRLEIDLTDLELPELPRLTEPPRPTPRPAAPTSTEPGAADPHRVDLGTVFYPTGTPREAVTEHPWSLPSLKPPSYRLGYALGTTSERAMHDRFHRFAAQVGHERVTASSFRWRPPPGCRDAGLKCVYEQLEADARAAVAPLSALFVTRARAGGLSSLEAAALVVSFIQEMTYEIPADEPFGVLPPALVVRRRKGDCDSKALLAHMILGAMGVDSVLVSSDAHQHTMLGIALPAAGQWFTFQGRRYAFVEMTAKGAPIGHIDPRLLRPADWRAIPVRLGK